MIIITMMITNNTKRQIDSMMITIIIIIITIIDSQFENWPQMSHALYGPVDRKTAAYMLAVADESDRTGSFLSAAPSKGRQNQAGQVSSACASFSSFGLALPPAIRERLDACHKATTVGFHNFNLRIFNLRVSNPNKLIVDVFLTR